jgi:rhodanese-related sulfurtransferase
VQYKVLDIIFGDPANGPEKIMPLLKAQMSGFSVHLMKDNSIISVDKNEDHVLDVRMTNELTELYIKEPAVNAPTSILKDIDLDVKNISTLAISCVRPSKIIHILIELNASRNRVPVKVTFSRDNTLVSTYDNRAWNVIRPSALKLAERIWRTCFPNLNQSK